MIDIEPGSRIQVAVSPNIGDDFEFNLVSTFKEALDESSFLVSVPLKDGVPFVVDENTKLLFKYAVGNEAAIIAAYKDDELKVGIRKFWKMRRVSEQRHFFERADARIKCALHCEFWLETWPMKDGKIPREESLTLDISAGGMAVFMPLHFEVGEMCKILLPRVGTAIEGNEIECSGKFCWCREAPKGSPYRLLYGLQYHFSDDADKDRMKAYIDNLKKVYKL